ncbi:MAG: GNAT family N-acetyltransferase [Candidatus Margulisiibacteriota bacterium]
MQVVPLTENNRTDWDNFCCQSDDAWFWHTIKWLDYCVVYGQENFGTNNLSFLVKDDTGLIAICPLLCEKDLFAARGGGRYGALPALANGLSGSRREKVIKYIFEKIDELAGGGSIKKIYFRSSPLAKTTMKFNWLVKLGYLDDSLNTELIQLDRPIDDIWAAVRKGHKYDINRGSKHYKVDFIDRHNADKTIFDQYRLLHHKAAGRVTRPVETFEMMYRWIKDGEGLLCGLSFEGRFVGFSYVCIYKSAAYYASASDDPDFKDDVPISHVIQWETIKYLKNLGFKTYEIGVQQFGPQFNDLPSDKEVSISNFKRGFGGETVTYYRGVKYFDKEYMQKELSTKLNQLTLDYQIGGR